MFVNRAFSGLRLKIRLSLRSHLILLVLISMIPLLIFATAMVVRLSQAELETFRRGARERTLALITAVDTDLNASIGTLQALAASDHLDTGNLVSFRMDAERVLKSQPDWRNIHLAQPSGQQVVDLRRTPAAAPGTVRNRFSFDRVVKTMHPVIDNLRLGRKGSTIDFVIRVPVLRDRVLKYVLYASVAPQSISALLARQKLPQNWLGAVFDGTGRYVARTAAARESVGQLAPDNYRPALAGASEGWVRGRTIEGRDVYIAYNRSPLSGWTVGLGIPAASVDAIFYRSLYYTILVGLTFLAFGIALAWGLSMRTAKSIEGLSHLAEGLHLDQETAKGSNPIPITEVEAVRGVLIKAAHVIEERSNERDRVEASLRRVTERLELAQAAANIGTFEGDLQANRIEWSPSMEMLYGLPPGGFGGTYDDWRRLVHPDDIAVAETTLQSCIETKVPVDTEYRIMRSDGAVRWVAARARLVADGGMRRIVGVNIDITERKQVEEELYNATLQLREADRRKDEFLAVLGHELRNPLSVINMTVQLLRSRNMLSERRLAELPEVITSQVSHMVRLVDDLLDVSRITRGQIRLNMEPCDLTALTREALEEQRRLLTEGSLSLKPELPDEPLWVIGDSTRLKQVIGNGLQNANKFTDSGGTITVTLRREGESSAVLAIRDTGVGMDATILKRAFEPFSQAERTIKRSRSGLGLGLALVKGIIELHHGSVSLHSDGPGTGSELTLRLPLTESPSANPVVPTAEPTFRSCRVLLIEDDRAGAHAMGMILTGIGHEVEVTYSGEEGIEAARRFRPEVVLCDIDLPGIDGFAVAKALRREPITSRTYLIAFSGYGQVLYQRQASESGFNAYLTKPINLSQLTAALSGGMITSAQENT